MRTTITIDDELVERAMELTGITRKSELVERAMRALIHREASQRLAKMGGTEPDLKPIPRRKSKPFTKS